MMIRFKIISSAVLVLTLHLFNYSQSSFGIVMSTHAQRLSDFEYGGRHLSRFTYDLVNGRIYRIGINYLLDFPFGKNNKFQLRSGSEFDFRSRKDGLGNMSYLGLWLGGAIKKGHKYGIIGSIDFVNDIVLTDNHYYRFNSNTELRIWTPVVRSGFGVYYRISEKAEILTTINYQTDLLRRYSSTTYYRHGFHYISTSYRYTQEAFLSLQLNFKI